MLKKIPKYRRKEIMSYETPPSEFQNCQSHLSDETLEQMKKDFKMSKKLNTTNTISYLMKQHSKIENEHLGHWLTTDLGKAWVERQENKKQK